jgi:hypothetical protein
MLFLLIMEVVSALIRKADEWPLLQDLGVRSIPLRAAFYTDELILFKWPTIRDLQALCDLFNMFEGKSGLRCDLSKCQMVPI